MRKEGMRPLRGVVKRPEEYLSGGTFRRAAPFTSLCEFFEIGDVVQHSAPDFAEPGPTAATSFLGEEASTDAQVRSRFRFDQQPTVWKARYNRSGRISWNGDFLVHLVPPRQAH